MPHIDNARSDAGAGSKFGGFRSQHTKITSNLQGLAGPRFERMVEHLHSLGPRPTAELLAEIAADTGATNLVVGLVEKYAELDPEIVRAVGGDRFPPSVLGVIR